MSDDGIQSVFNGYQPAEMLSEAAACARDNARWWREVMAIGKSEYHDDILRARAQLCDDVAARCGALLPAGYQEQNARSRVVRCQCGHLHNPRRCDTCACEAFEPWTDGTPLPSDAGYQSAEYVRGVEAAIDYLERMNDYEAAANVRATLIPNPSTQKDKNQDES